MDYNFYNNWLDVSGLYSFSKKDHIVNLSEDFFSNLRFDSISIKNNRVRCAELVSKTLGNKPALLLSGGVDSQAMVQCWLEANLPCEIVIFKFKNNLNTHDYEVAIEFCAKNKIKYRDIEFDILQFLNRDNFSIAEKYRSLSPHFNAHYKMAEILRDEGYTGICCGGFVPTNINNMWGTNFNFNNCRYTTIHQTLGIPFQGNFLGYLPELCWTVALLADKLNVGFDMDMPFSKYNLIMEERYETKLKSYELAGFKIIPQLQKYTGFELVKEYYKKITNDGWYFEKQFRYTLKNIVKHKDNYLYKLGLSALQLKEISDIQLNNFGPTF